MVDGVTGVIGGEGFQGLYKVIAPSCSPDLLRPCSEAAAPYVEIAAQFGNPYIM